MAANETRRKAIMDNLQLAMEITKNSATPEHVPDSVIAPLVDYVAPDANSLASDIREYFLADDQLVQSSLPFAEQLERLETLMVEWCMTQVGFKHTSFGKVQRLLQDMPRLVSTVELEDGTANACMADQSALPPFFNVKIVDVEGSNYIVTLSKFWVRVFYYNAKYLAAFNTLTAASPNDISDDNIASFIDGFANVVGMIEAEQCFDGHWFAQKKRKAVQE